MRMRTRPQRGASPAQDRAVRRFGYINTKGEWLVKPRFVSAGSFHGGYARATALHRESPSIEECGCSVDSAGQVRRLMRVGENSEFSEGICKTRGQDSTIGFVSGDGEEIAAPIYSDATNFCSGRAIVSRHVPRTGPAAYDSNPQYETLLIDRCGKVLREIAFDRLRFHDFSDGLALSRAESNNEPVPAAARRRLNRWFDTGGNVAVTFDGDAIAYDFHDGYAVVSRDGAGLIDRSGKLVIPFRDQSLGVFSDGLISAEINDRWYFLDANGEKVISLPEGCVQALPFSQGLAAFATQSPWSDGGNLYRVHTDGWGFIDRTGKVVIPPEFVGWDSHFTEEGLALVGNTVDGSLKFGFIDRNGEYVIRPQFGSCKHFSEGFAAVESESLGFIREDWIGWMGAGEYPNRSEDLLEFFKAYKVFGMERSHMHEILGAGSARVDDEGDIESYAISIFLNVHGSWSVEFLYVDEKVVGWRRTGGGDAPAFYRASGCDDIDREHWPL